MPVLPAVPSTTVPPGLMLENHESTIHILKQKRKVNHTVLFLPHHVRGQEQLYPLHFLLGFGTLPFHIYESQSFWKDLSSISADQRCFLSLVDTDNNEMELARGVFPTAPLKP